jgi:hypothetical protein
MKGAKSPKKISISRHRITGDRGPKDANRMPPHTRVSYEILGGFETSDMEEIPNVAKSREEESGDHGPKDTGGEAILVALSNAPLLLLFAQDMFRSFMDAIGGNWPIQSMAGQWFYRQITPVPRMRIPGSLLACRIQNCRR